LLPCHFQREDSSQIWCAWRKRVREEARVDFVLWICNLRGDPWRYAEAEASPGFGDRPLIVLTRGKIDTPASPSEADRQYAAYMQVWMHEIQPKLARLSTRGRQIILPNSGHGIPEEAPDAVVAAVAQVVDSIRGGLAADRR
jgi:hypothetical protein